jgi:hypothetical protein
MGTEPVTPRPLTDIIDCPVPTLDIVDIGAMLEDGRDRYDALIAQNLARVTGPPLFAGLLASYVRLA